MTLLATRKKVRRAESLGVNAQQIEEAYIGSKVASTPSEQKAIPEVPLLVIQGERYVVESLGFPTRGRASAVLRRVSREAPKLPSGIYAGCRVRCRGRDWYIGDESETMALSFVDRT